MNYLLYLLIVLFSKLPLNIIYKVTDGLVFILFHVVGYRKGVIKENIKNSFPEKSSQEIDQIIKEFHTQFSSLFAEMIKLFSISKEEHSERMKFIDTKEFEESIGKNNSIVLCGHIINWELTSICPQVYDTVFRVVYMKLQNPFWDKKLYEIRNKYGLIPIEMQKTVDIIKNTPNDGKNVFLVVGDQSPHLGKAKYTLKFMGRETPIFVGYDFLAREKKLAVFYAEIIQIKRGYYETRLKPIEPSNGVKFEELEISRKFFAMLEKTIRKNPSNYFWTHKRWKHKKGIDF